MGKTAIATLLTLVLAFLLVLPLIGLGVQAARESGALVHWIDDVRQHGLGTPDWLSHVPVVGASLAAGGKPTSPSRAPPVRCSAARKPAGFSPSPARLASQSRTASPF